MDCEHEWLYITPDDYDAIFCMRCYQVKWFVPPLKFERADSILFRGSYRLGGYRAIEQEGGSTRFYDDLGTSPPV